MAQDKRPVRRKQAHQYIFGCVIVALLATMGFAVLRQTGRIRKTMDDSAFQNMESIMRTVAGTITATFSMDQAYMQSLTSTVSLTEDMDTWIETVDYDRSKILNLYYSDLEAETAHGKNGKTIDLSGRVFTEHRNGQVRSGAYMTEIGTYAYLQREPIQKNGDTVGYLYAELLMSRFLTLLPRIVTDNNDITLMDSATMTYVQLPSRKGSGTHINFHRLKYYLRDEALAEQITAEANEAIKQHEYYMRMLTFYRTENGEQGTKNYVLFLWPVDDGEYYLSGVSALDSLQGERNSVLHTTNLMIGILLGTGLVVVAMITMFYARVISDNRKRVLTQQKHNEELDEALQLAKAANESKSNFLSNMSHDIRTPMNAIIGYTTLIGKDADHPEKVREYTKKISSAGDYLLSLINDVLDMSKIESGKTTLNITQFRIHRLVNEIESLIRMQAEARQQSFAVSVENVTHDSVMGDEMRIRQVILNLLSNALKYTPDGGAITFTVEGVPQKKANIQKLRIIVRDTGYGMDADYIKTIFEPFTRLNNSMTGKIRVQAWALPSRKTLWI